MEEHILKYLDRVATATKNDLHNPKFGLFRIKFDRYLLLYIHQKKHSCFTNTEIVLPVLKPLKYER